VGLALAGAMIAGLTMLEWVNVLRLLNGRYFSFW
jgi:hypothetical protein